ncbi:MAG: hypothetical protein M1812_005551 [Candelaria pacifica]|nr:MAG: hypothetical protein M1812_005551 [Candelaria pacifica]
MVGATATQISSSVRSGDHDDLLVALDNALERYLNLLHQYQGLQQELASILANGNLSLARANFSSPTRIRYGSDFYDERMQATRKIVVKKSPISASVLEQKHHPLVSAIEFSSSTVAPVQEQGSLEASVSNAQESESNMSDVRHASRDPLRWFGMFVPPALRSAQNCFARAVSDVIPNLATIVEDLSAHEDEIGRIRAELNAER